MTLGSDVQKYEDLEDVLESNEYLPRLQLLTSASDVVKEDPSLANEYALITSDNLQTIGKDIEIFPTICRPKALDMSGDTPVTSFDQKSDVFNDIKNRSFQSNSKCMYGVEFLVYLPEQERYATWFLSTKSHRKLYKPVQALAGGAASLSSKLVQNSDYKWQVSTVVASTKEYGENDIPDEDVTNKVIESFNNEQGTEVAEEATAGSRD